LVDGDQGIRERGWKEGEGDEIIACDKGNQSSNLSCAVREERYASGEKTDCWQLGNDIWRMKEDGGKTKQRVVEDLDARKETGYEKSIPVVKIA